MEAKLFVLTAFIVNFTTAVKKYDMIEDLGVAIEENSRSNARENFQNLFESIAKNDMKKGEIYRRILNKNTAKERQVFGLMEGELWDAIKKNMEKKGKIYRKTNVNINSVAVKRETNYHHKDQKMEPEINTDKGYTLNLKQQMTNPQINIEELKKNKSIEVVPVPNSTDTQILTEALYLNKQDDFPQIKSIARKQRKVLNVCNLSSEEAKDLCYRLQPDLVKGKYYLECDMNVEECKPYQIVLHHTHSYAHRRTVKARKCPYQPDELFLTSGNEQMSLFVLTWVNNEKTYLHLDHYFDVEAQ